jgi:hypothetical protein
VGKGNGASGDQVKSAWEGGEAGRGVATGESGMEG